MEMWICFETHYSFKPTFGPFPWPAVVLQYRSTMGHKEPFSYLHQKLWTAWFRSVSNSCRGFVFRLRVQHMLKHWSLWSDAASVWPRLSRSPWPTGQGRWWKSDAATGNSTMDGASRRLIYV